MEGNYQINFFRIVFYVSETLFPASDDLPPQSLLHLWEQEYFPGIAQIHCICILISLYYMYLYLDFHSEYVYLADIAEIHLLPNHSQEMYSIPFPHGEDTWDQF